MQVEFFIEDYVERKITESAHNTPKIGNNRNESLTFEALCEKIRDNFKLEVDDQSTVEAQMTLKHQKAAILGDPIGVQYYKDKIDTYLQETGQTKVWYPSWYKNLVDAVFHENWGLDGMAPWVYNYKEEYSKSTSAKIIGDRIFYLVNGKMEIQPQRISKERLTLLKKSLISGESSMKITDPYNDVYLHDGTRVTIFGSTYTKRNRETIIFRKYILSDLSLEDQIELKTIPDYSEEFFRLAVELGYNTLIVGGPNSGKSTFYETLQMYENPQLQGIQIETDPEVDMYHLMPNSPIMELLADGENLKKIIKPILRADPDYLKIGEARDGIALHVVVRSANKGTRRVKVTYHITSCLDICYQIAEEIVEDVGGSVKHTAVKVARSFSYIYEFFYLNNDKNHKLLRAIYELSYDEINNIITMNIICKYNIRDGIWEWAYHFGEDKRETGYLESISKTDKFESLIKKFSKQYPYKGTSEFHPRYAE